MKNKGFITRLLALVCCGAILFGTLPMGVFAEETEETQPPEKKDTYVIENNGDFLKFEENCRIDAWSSGRTVELRADLNLAGQEFQNFSGIATFAGIFDGGGHTISGVALTGNNGATGLFRYLDPGAQIRNLTVSGTVTSDNSSDTLGGIVGVNFGTVSGCTFLGTVTGAGVSGGVVGLNGASGTVSGCTGGGTVTSKFTVGGVVGKNYGVVSDCTNTGSVNADSSWVDDDASDSSQSLVNQGKERFLGGSDIGGIAGWSSGTLAGCKNSGIVGYQKAGRNVGGIAGRQCGTVVNCKNTGTVYGKQDVGGIVGQFEPSVTVEDTEQLSTEVNKLHELIDQAVGDLQSLNGTVHSDMSDLQAHSDTARQTADKMLKEARDVADANMDTLNDLSSRVDYVKNHLPTVMDELDAAFDGMSDVEDDMDQIREDLDILGKMDDSTFDPTKNTRLTLTPGIGGSLRANNSNPEAGTQVTITVTENTGYVLRSLKISGNGEQDVTSQVEDGSYTFTMPEENVQVLAAFDYVGEYLPESNPGGQAQAVTDGDNLKIRAVADDGYVLESIRVDGTSVDLSSGENDVYTVAKPADPSAKIQVTFRAMSGGYQVLTPRTTGGRVQADMSKAEAGSTVTVTVSTDSGYKLTELTMNGSSILGSQSGERSYTFTMPSKDATVQAEYAYEGDGDVYCLSNPGGTLSATANPVSNDYILAIVPDSGYVLASSGTVLTLKDNAGTVKELTRDDLTEALGGYTYTMSMNNYEAPVEAKAAFTKDDSALTVTAVTSAGGTVTASKTQASPGDEISFAVVSGAHYGLTKFTVNGEDKTGDLESGVVRYTIPDGASGEIKAVAQFQPVRLALTSVDDAATGGTAEGGSATYTVSGTQVEVKISPSAGYSAEVVETSTGITLDKPYADSEIYRFPAQDGWIHVTFHKQNDKDTIQEAADRIDRNMTVISDRMQDMQDTYDAIDDLLTDDFGNPRDLKDLSDEELKELRNLMKDLGDEISDVTVAAGQIASDTSTIVNLAGPYVKDAAEALQDDLEKLNDDMRNVTEHLQAAQKEAKAIVDYLNSLDKVEFTGFSEEFNKNADKVSDEMETISKILSRLNDNLAGNSNRLTADLRKINDQLTVVLNLLIDRMDDLEDLSKGGDLIVDMSAEPEDEDTEAASKIAGCENAGVVDGTSNVGGIAGTVGIEADTSDSGVGIGSKYMVRAALSDCRNTGFITARSENGGGIAGLVEAGLLSNCYAGGSVSSDSGNYMGGIAGTSRGTITKCSVLTEITGASYIGGIAGTADTITDCYAMPTIYDTTGRVGAISGADDPGDSDDPTDNRMSLAERIRDNYFVSDSLGGIDGVSYDGVAMPVSYKELLTKDGVPEAFRHLTVTFVDSTGAVIYTQELVYGESLEKLNYPNVTAETGNYSDWEGYRTETMTGNLILRSAQVLTTRILSGGDTEGKPAALAEGNFTAAARLEVTQVNLEPPKLPSKAQWNMVQVRITQGELDGDSVSRVRLLYTGDTTATVYSWENDTWTEIPSEQIGQYLQVNLTGDEGTFCIVQIPEQKFPTVYVAAGAAVAAAALVIVLVAVRKKKKTKAAK